MKRKLLIFLTAALLLSAGCAAKSPASSQTPGSTETSPPQTTQPDTTQTETTTPDTAQIGCGFGNEDFVPSIGGIVLGASYDEVIAAFGEDVEERSVDEGAYYGQPFIIMDYKDVMVVLGADSRTVLEIETTSGDVENNLGYAVGDSAKDALDAYGALYVSPKSNQDGKALTGWFLIREQELVIFNFDQTDVLVNGELKDDSHISRLRLSDFRYMD